MTGVRGVIQATPTPDVFFFTGEEVVTITGVQVISPGTGLANY
jgi:hypothetical protein